MLESLLPELVVGHRRLAPAGRRLLEPPGRQVGRAHLVLVRQGLEQLAYGLVQHRVLELGGEIGERPEDEGALVHQEMRDVQVVRAADHPVVVEEDVDIERARLVALVLRPLGPSRAAHQALHVLDLLEEDGRLASMLLAEFPCSEVRVRVRKLTPPMEGLQGVPGVELTRRR